MLVQMDTPQQRNAVSLLDSPILKRVERATLRHDAGVGGAQRTTLAQTLLSERGCSGSQVLKRGLMWQQRDRLFARWKERYFVLTPDYLQCFRRATGISQMGEYLFKVKLADVEKVEWLNRKTHSLIGLRLTREGSRLLLRHSTCLEDWFELLEECCLASKERRRALRLNTNNNSMLRSNALEQFLTNRSTPSHLLSSSDSRDGTVILRRNLRRDFTRGEDEDVVDSWQYPASHMDPNNRLSLLTDIDINSYDESSGAPSLTNDRDSYREARNYERITNHEDLDSLPTPGSSYRANQAHFCDPRQLIRFRERSYSDILQRGDRKLQCNNIPMRIQHNNNGYDL